MSEEIGQIQPHALYTVVMNNHFNIKSILLDRTIGLTSDIDKDLSKTSSLDANLSKTTWLSSDEEPGHSIIDVVFNRSEFDNLIETKEYARTKKKERKLLFRQYQVLQTGKWQNAIITKLWEACKLQCGYQFKKKKKNEFFNNTLTICGKYNCGSTINRIAKKYYR